MSKIDELQKQYEAAKAECDRLTAETEKMLSKKESLEEKAEEAAAAGNEAEYNRLLKNADELQRIIHFNEVRKDTLGKPIPEEEAVQAWSEYIKPYHKQLPQEHEKYLAMRHELAMQFVKLMELQLNAMKTRERLAYMTGRAKNGNDIVHYGACTPFPMDYLTLGDVNIDRRFFEDRNEIEKSKGYTYYHMALKGNSLT